MRLRFLIMTVVLMPMASSHAGSGLTLDQKWEKFKKDFGKNYGPNNNREEANRKKIFKQNVAKIDAHNALYSKKQASYTMGINQFSDMDSLEFKAKRTTSFPPLNSIPDAEISSSPKISTFQLPGETLNWRAKGYVTPVIDQGNLGSCYIISAIGALEGQLFRKTKKLQSLSVQQLIDCMPLNHTGGWPHQAIWYIMKVGGINTAEKYPYTGIKRKCQFKFDTAGVMCKSYHVYRYQTESQLKSIVSRVGPVSIGIYSSENLGNYRSGVYDDEECYKKPINHAVLLVGYGTDKESGKDYWLIKNSWGSKDTDGYVKMVRNKGNQCGIGSYVAYPVLFKTGQ